MVDLSFRLSTSCRHPTAAKEERQIIKLPSFLPLPADISQMVKKGKKGDQPVISSLCFQRTSHGHSGEKGKIIEAYFLPPPSELAQTGERKKDKPPANIPLASQGRKERLQNLPSASTPTDGAMTNLPFFSP